MVELLGDDATNVVAVWRYECILTENENASTTTRAKLLEFINDSQNIEDGTCRGSRCGVHFTRATYNIEGDGLLALICYDRILEIRKVLNSAYYQNLQVVAQETFSRNAHTTKPMDFIGNTMCPAWGQN